VRGGENARPTSQRLLLTFRPSPCYRPPLSNFCKQLSSSHYASRTTSSLERRLKLTPEADCVGKLAENGGKKNKLFSWGGGCLVQKQKVLNTQKNMLKMLRPLGACAGHRAQFAASSSFAKTIPLVGMRQQGDPHSFALHSQLFSSWSRCLNLSCTARMGEERQEFEHRRLV